MQNRIFSPLTGGEVIMLNPAAMEDVLRLIELRSRFDDCQQQLLDLQVENTLLKTANSELRARLSPRSASGESRVNGAWVLWLAAYVR